MVPLTLSVETGDVSAEPFRRSTLKVFPDTVQGVVVLSLNGVPADVKLEEWDEFVQQVSEQSLKKWQFAKTFPAPMGAAAVRRLVSQITTTPLYQIFLAGVEITNKIGLVHEDDESIVLSQCYLLANYVRSDWTGGLFFFLPRQLQEVSQNSMKELVDNNKLCVLTVQRDGSVVFQRYFVPYSTPNDFYAPNPASPAAKDLWEQLRNIYYAFR